MQHIVRFSLLPIDYSQMPPLEKLSDDDPLIKKEPDLKVNLGSSHFNPQTAKVYYREWNNRCLSPTEKSLSSPDDCQFASQPPDLIPMDHVLKTESLTPPMSTSPNSFVEHSLNASFLNKEGPSTYSSYELDSSKVLHNSEHPIHPKNSVSHNSSLKSNFYTKKILVSYDEKCSPGLGCLENDRTSLPSNSSWSKSTVMYPRELTTNNMKRVKNVTCGSPPNPSIPQLNYKEVPQVILSNSQDDEDSGRKISGGRLLNNCSRYQRDLHTLSCVNNCSYGVNCSSASCQEPFSSFDDQHRDKDSHRGGPPHGHKLHSHSSSPLPNGYQEYSVPDDSERYLRRPIAEWSYADVIFFLMEACKELRIDPGDVKIKKTDTGAMLLNMTPAEFDALVPNNGQKLYDHFINFKTQHHISSADCSSYGNFNNDQYMPHYMENAHHNLYQDNNYQGHHHPHYQNRHQSQQHFPHQDFSPGSDYLPQGAQYNDGSIATTEEPMEYHDLPSAAGKTFAPLHNFDSQVSDPDISEEEEKPPEPPKKRGPGRPPKPENQKKRKAKKTGRLWEFIRNLLLDPKTCPSLVRWEDPTTGVFRIVQSDAMANVWGSRKNNLKMNYEKLSRAMRYYYKAKIFEPVWGKRLVYKFGINAKGWRPVNPNNPNFLTPT